MSRLLISLIFALFVSLGVATAQEPGPVLVPERLQEIAQELGIGDALEINWSDAGVDDIGRYMGFLAAANEIAREIALKNGREEPLQSDYIAALAVACSFPPNKPGIVREYWPRMFIAFFDPDTQGALMSAVGDQAVELAEALRVSFVAQPGITAVHPGFPFHDYLPGEEDEYLENVLDLRVLP